MPRPPKKNKIMDREYKIRFGKYQSPYYLGLNITDKYIKRIDQTLKPDRYFIVCDKNIKKLFAQNLAKIFLNYKPCHIIDFYAGESSKNIDIVKEILERIIKLGATRTSCIVALGGGLTGNLAGLSASLLFRGVRFIQIPTTFLAASDSVLSLKQAINSMYGKNLIGTFYPPEMVLFDLKYLKSLPKQEIKAGLAETIKNALAISPEFIPKLEKILNLNANYSQKDFLALTEFCIKAKSKVLENDPYEKKSGLILEYGHTVGHALEFASFGKFHHGQSVSVGMIIAAEISNQMGFLDKRFVEIHYELLKQAGCPTVIPKKYSTQSITDTIKFDNKRGYLKEIPDKVFMVLLTDLGKPRIENGQLLTPVPIRLIEEVVKRNQLNG